MAALSDNNGSFPMRNPMSVLSFKGVRLSRFYKVHASGRDNKIGALKMETLILGNQPSFHATVLSIVLTVYSAYALFVYQAINTSLANLYSIKYQLPSWGYFIGDVDSNSYMKEGRLDEQMVYSDLFQTSWLFSHLDNPQIHEIISGKDVSPDEIRHAGDRLFGLLTLIRLHYPYRINEKDQSDRTSSIEFIASWVNHFAASNKKLLWFLDTHRNSLRELASRYAQLCLEIQNQEQESIRNRYIDLRRQSGETVTEQQLEKMKRSAKAMFKNIDYLYVLSKAHSDILYIDQRIMPEIRKEQRVLDFYKQQHNIKPSIYAITGCALVVFVIGVMVPLFLASIDVSIGRNLGLFILFVPLTIYLVALIYLAVVLARKVAPW